jgi:hypothetical protein
MVYTAENPTMPFRFEKHVFISYSHLDNDTDTPGKDGWVSHLEKTLYGQLSTRLGEKARIWRDPTLRGNEDFPEEIVGQFSNAALLVSVISPGYLNSKWCKRELTGFCDAAEHTTGLKIGNKYRVLKIVKLPVEREKQDTLHPMMSHMLGYEFYTGGKEDTAIELDPEYAENAQLYRTRVAMLAQDIAVLLKQLAADSEGSTQVQTAAPCKATVYLADCAYDRRTDRNFLAAELKARNYKVLPENSQINDRPEYTADVSRLLEESKLAIHLIGNGYGTVPDGPGEQKSVVVLQNELAIERSRSAGLARIIWIPDGATPDNSVQETFIKSLLEDANAQFGADLIRGGFEALKENVIATLRKLEEPKPEKTPEQTAAEPKLVYIVCDAKDRENTIPLRKFLKSRGLEARIPIFQGEATAVREANQQALRDCDAVMIFYGAGEETWKRAVDCELLKLPGYHPGKPRPLVFTYLAGPDSPDKRDLLELEPDVIDGLQGFPEAALEPLMTKFGRLP